MSKQRTLWQSFLRARSVVVVEKALIT